MISLDSLDSLEVWGVEFTSLVDQFLLDVGTEFIVSELGVGEVVCAGDGTEA